MHDSTSQPFAKGCLLGLLAVMLMAFDEPGVRSSPSPLADETPQSLVEVANAATEAVLSPALSLLSDAF
jgi:hypothetical protein